MRLIRSHRAGRAPASLSRRLLRGFVLVTLALGSGGALAGGKAAQPDPALGARIAAAARQTVELDPANFAQSERIDHAWWPLKPGTQWIFEGFVEEEHKRVPHRQVFTVTDLTKKIGGVRCRVILDADYSEGKLIEKELTFFAQDKRGNVWHLGQYVETWEDDVFVGGHTWTVGNPRGAKAGIMMPAELHAGTPSYSEGYAPPPFSWTDRGRIVQTGQKIRVRAGSYDDVLVIEESDATHPGAFQLKYYARGVGNVRVGARGKNLEARETLELVKVNQLDPAALAQVRATALGLEERGLMYSTLAPVERPGQ